MTFLTRKSNLCMYKEAKKEKKTRSRPIWTKREEKVESHARINNNTFENI